MGVPIQVYERLAMHENVIKEDAKAGGPEKVSVLAGAQQGENEQALRCHCDYPLTMTLHGPCVQAVLLRIAKVASALLRATVLKPATATAHIHAMYRACFTGSSEGIILISHIYIYTYIYTPIRPPYG